MPDLAKRLERPLETATGGADFADMIVRRLGLSGIPGKLEKWLTGTRLPVEAIGHRRILTGYYSRAGRLVAELPDPAACCDTAAIIEDIRAGGPSEHTLAMVGGAAAGAAAQRYRPDFHR